MKTVSGSQQNKRIGFILETISSGSASKLWLTVAENAAKKPYALFVFPGGKNASYLQNNIYSLANPKNVDGLILWASSVGNLEASEHFKTFSTLPFVTIGQKIEGHSFVSFDVYSGMKSLVRHFIHEHGAKRIAFVRAPEYHSSAQERFRAYMDVLREENLYSAEYERLITTPCDWHEAEKAAHELYELRGLVPGKDFDALIAASDLMAISVMDYFKKKGFKIPEECLFGGFNDSDESRAAVPPLSTLHIPYSAIGTKSYEKIETLLDTGVAPDDDVFPVFPIFRESCGCNTMHDLTGEHESKNKIRNQKALAKEIQNIICKKDDEPFSKSIDAFLNALFENAKVQFNKAFERFLTEYFKHENEITDIFKIVHIIKTSGCFPAEYLEDFLYSANLHISKIQNKMLSEKIYDISKQNLVVNNLKTELLSVHSSAALVYKLKEFLPRLGIKKCGLVLYENDELSKYVGGFDEFSDSHVSKLSSYLFSSQLLFPDSLKTDFSRGVFIVQPLFTKTKPLGFLICDFSRENGTFYDGIIYEEIRSIVSRALENILLFEEISHAKNRAEKAEFEKNEFFANVGSELCTPLKDLSLKVSQIEDNVNDGLIDPDILGEQLIFLRSQIDAQLQKTKTLVELTRSQINDLPMEKSLFDIRTILPVSVTDSISEEVPLLYGDPSRLKKAFDTIFEYAQTDIFTRIDLHGIHFHFQAPRINWSRPEFLLAEKIILLQYGDIKKTDEIQITLFWPNLAGLSPIRIISDDIHVHSLSTKCEYAVFGKKIEKFTTSLPDDKDIVFIWNPDTAPMDEWIKIYSHRKNERIFRAPLLCFSQKLVGHNFLEIFEQKMRAQKTSSVLFVNTKYSRYGTWATDANSVSISSMAEFDKILKEINPILIVFEDINKETIVKIRQNQKTVLTPILVLPDSVLDDEKVEILCSYPKIILCNRGVAESKPFDERIQNIIMGEEILPPHTGALVKKAILYLNKNARSQIVRWKLADTIHVSEDYLTRIFHKEIGVSLWEYLNRYRIFIATKLLYETNDSISEIAERTGFQDQAYFCRVFKKIYGVPPGKIRTKS